MFLKRIIFRTLFIKVENTPNPLCLKFNPGKVILSGGSMNFPAPSFAEVSPLAQRLWGIKGVAGVFYGSDYISVTKNEEILWEQLKPHIVENISDFYEKNLPLFKQGFNPIQAEAENDTQLIGTIKDILASQIRPTVERDGGDVKFLEFNEQTGILLVEMIGSCAGCPSSVATLKQGIERVITFFVPQVKEVRAINVKS